MAHHEDLLGQHTVFNIIEQSNRFNRMSPENAAMRQLFNIWILSMLLLLQENKVWPYNYNHNGSQSLVPYKRTCKMPSCIQSVRN